VPDSFEALLVIFFAVLPGATFVYAMERQVGAWGAKAADRLLRFVILSAVLYLVLIPYGYLLYRVYILSGKLTQTDDFNSGDWLELFGHWLFLLAYFGLLPWLIGTWLGHKLKDEEEKGTEGWVSWMLGQHMRPPRAFEHLFARDDLYGIVRMLIGVTDNSFTWVAGSFSDEGPSETPQKRPRRAYVSTYPEDPEIYLPVRFRCDPTTGALEYGTDGKPVASDIGVLVNADKIAYLEFIDG
jgi:hypothetical protein